MEEEILKLMGISKPESDSMLQENPTEYHRRYSDASNKYWSGKMDVMTKTNADLVAKVDDVLNAVKPKEEEAKKQEENKTPNPNDAIADIQKQESVGGVDAGSRQDFGKAKPETLTGQILASKQSRFSESDCFKKDTP